MRQGHSRFTSSPVVCGFKCRAAFALVDVLISMGLITLLSGFLLVMALRARQAGRSAECLSNLHSIGFGFSQYAARDGCFPNPLASGKSWESLLEPYLKQPRIYQCPADTEVYPTVGSSYDWRDTANPVTTLSGKRLVEVRRPDTVLAFETLPGWHGKHQMNAVRVDGSAVSMDEDECLSDLLAPIRP